MPMVSNPAEEHREQEVATAAERKAQEIGECESEHKGDQAEGLSQNGYGPSI